MNTGLVNASQLLIPFLGKEQAKIGKQILQSDFSGELAKQIARPGAKGLLGRLSPDAAGVEKSTGNGAAKPAAAKNGAAKKTRPEVAKALADAGNGLVLANPALAQKVLSELQVPSENIKACKSLQDGQGRISLKDFASLLNPAQDSTSAPAEGAAISADTARELVASIVRAQTPGAAPAAPSGETSSSVQIDPEGYDIEGFRALLNQVRDGHGGGKRHGQLRRQDRDRRRRGKRSDNH